MCAEARQSLAVVLAVGLCLGPAALPAREAAAGDWVLGRIEPRGGVRLHVPACAGAPALLVQRVADGARVRAGDELAAFAFDPAGARARAELGLKRAEVRVARELAERRERILALEAKRELAAIEARKATLDKSRAGVLSKRDAALVELDARLATFELEAVERRLTAQVAWLEAERALGTERVTQAREGLERIAVLAGRYRLVAPGAGRIHWLDWLEPGVRLEPGEPIAWFAPGDGLEVVFEVPADDRAEYRPGRAVTLKDLSGDQETYARVTSGPEGLARPDEHGGAWFEIRAELPADTRGFGVGQPVRVGP